MKILMYNGPPSKMTFPPGVIRHRTKSQEVQRSVCREFVSTLVREAEDTAKRNDFRSLYCITKELARSGKLFDYYFSYYYFSLVLFINLAKSIFREPLVLFVSAPSLL